MSDRKKAGHAAKTATVNLTIPKGPVKTSIRVNGLDAPGVKTPTPPRKPDKVAANQPGVGGSLSIFRLAVADEDPKNPGHYLPSKTNFADFELAPGRRSFFERQGQQIPGVGAGIEVVEPTNIAKINVPGSSQLQQAMGLGACVLDLAGAFIGFDEYYGDFDHPVHENPHLVGVKDAWNRSQQLAFLHRKQQELVLLLKWGEAGSRVFDYGHESGAILSFRGKIERLSRVFATPQRVYYRILFAVNNQPDLDRDLYDPSTSFQLPLALASDLATADDTGDGGSLGSDPPENAARGIAATETAASTYTVPPDVASDLFVPRNFVGPTYEARRNRVKEQVTKLNNLDFSDEAVRQELKSNPTALKDAVELESFTKELAGYANERNSEDARNVAGHLGSKAAFRKKKLFLESQKEEAKIDVKPLTAPEPAP